jgi:hypothetical protein
MSILYVAFPSGFVSNHIQTSPRLSANSIQLPAFSVLLHGFAHAALLINVNVVADLSNFAETIWAATTLTPDPATYGTLK